MRVTIKAQVTMTVVLEQYQSEEKSLAAVKQEMSNQIQDHVSKMLRPDKDDDIQVKATVEDVRVLAATHEG